MEPNAMQLPIENFERLTPKDLVRKHIADPKHQITEEEFNKLIVGVYTKEIYKDKEKIQ